MAACLPRWHSPATAQPTAVSSAGLLTCSGTCVCYQPTPLSLLPEGDLVAWGKRPRAIAGTKLDPRSHSTGEEPFLDTSAVSASGKALLGVRNVLVLQKWDAWRVRQKNPAGTFSPTPCILQARYKDLMCALVPFHAAVLLGNGAMLSSRPWSITMSKAALTSTTLTTGWKVLLSALMRTQQSQYSRPTQPALGQHHGISISGFFPPRAGLILSLHLPAGCLKGSSRNRQGDVLFFLGN